MKYKINGVIIKPTKGDLINFLSRLPISDDARLNVSINNGDISTAQMIESSVHPDESKKEFLLDFAVKR